MATEATVDTDLLRDYLASELGEDRPVDVDPVEAGRSNETLIVTWGDRDLVLRKPPVGASSEAAHDVLREYRIMDALQDTAAPVPETVLACDDHAVVGSDFYLMAYLDGHVIRSKEPNGFDAQESRQHLGTVLVETLAAIHSVDVESVGLADLGHPEGFTERQVDRWGKQLDWALERTDRRDELRELEEVSDWLKRNIPSKTPHALVHGDYKIDNVIFGPDPPPEIVGVVDWEMGTHGDPLTDVGWFLIHWHDASDPDSILPTVTPPFLAQDGYATRKELIDHYERTSGIKFTDERFYRGLAAYKEAAACEVFYARYIQGTENPFFEQMDEKVPQAAIRAKRIIDGKRPL